MALATDESSSYDSRIPETKELLRKSLPGYVVDSFIEAGFDTIDAIRTMDFETDLKSIEEFISNECKKDDRFERGFTESGRFRILPGHRKQIVSFLKSLKASNEKICRKRMRSNDEVPLQVPRKVAKEENKAEDAASIYQKLRVKLAKWQLSQKMNTINNLKEHKDFEINVGSTEDSAVYEVSITCKRCMKKYALGKAEGGYIVSNWTKHIIKCVKKPKEVSPSIHKFFDTKNKETQVGDEVVDKVGDEGDEGEDEQHFRLRPS